MDSHLPIEVRFFDAYGQETSSIEQARSKIEFRPWDYRFFVKVERLTFFTRKKVIDWKFHHQSSTFGSWMWPDGMPLRFDGSDNLQIAKEHAAKIGSSWRPGEDQ